jgi:hypothetical protein
MIEERPYTTPDSTMLISIPSAVLDVFSRGRVQIAAEDLRPRRVVAGAGPTYVIDVSRPVTPWRLRSMLLVPIELLALAWSVPVLMALVIAPIGLAFAIALWVVRLVFSR